MKRIIQIFIIGLLGFSMIGCHGCKDPVMADPCEGVEEVKADFKMEYYMGYNEDEQRYEADTVLEYERIYFSAIGKYDSVKWKVGLDPREFTKKKFSLWFEDAASMQIRMIGFRAPNLDCFPADDGVDTVFRQLVILPNEGSLMIGEFDGYFLSEPDSQFTMKIIRSNGTTWTPEFPKGCVKDPYHEGAFKWTAYRRLFNDDEHADCHGQLPFVWGTYFNDTLKLEYEYLPAGEKGTFIGIKK